jgi:electron-transferring-flavoprotein dehydrogenase
MSDRMTMEADIVCVGFGPASAGFLTTLTKATDLPPLNVLCYERADGIGYGVSGVVTRARGIRASMPGLDFSQIPMATPVTEEKLVYLRGPRTIEMPFIPPFLRKDDGVVMSIGQFLEYIGSQLMGTGTVQIWPGTPVEQAIIEHDVVRGVRLLGQDIDVHAPLTVVADGSVGAIGRQLDGDRRKPADWAVGMKMVLDLPADTGLAPGTVLHTFGYPEPEIFGFLYVHPGNVASVGIFVPSWMHSPDQSAYRYLQHYLLHPYVSELLHGARLRSWGAKSLDESGRRAEPVLVGNGWVRIGEGSATTNVLTGSGVDEAWTTGVQLGEGVVELVRAGKPLSRENLEATYVARRRASWVEREAWIAECARDGFHRGMLTGLFGMALAGFTNGLVTLGHHRPGPGRPERARKSATKREWPEIPYDGRLLVSHQDALLIGGKVQAAPGFADHVEVRDPRQCEQCADKRCVLMCSGQALAMMDGPAPGFDREKCVFCGACLWNCREGNIAFRVGAGGLHSNEN